MITGTFNGWNVVALPTSPSFSALELAMNDKVSAEPSAFSAATQILDWQIDWWDGRVSLPQMTRGTSAAWLAFLAECRGMSAAFMLGNPLNASPIGQPLGIPLVAGVNATRSSVLNTTGWKPGAFRLLKAGDHFQIGVRLHMTLEDVNADSSGNAALNIWPRIREAPANGDPIILHNPRGLFRLSDNARKVSMAVTKLYAVSLSITEAL